MEKIVEEPANSGQGQQSQHLKQQDRNTIDQSPTISLTSAASPPNPQALPDHHQPLFTQQQQQQQAKVNLDDQQLLGDQQQQNAGKPVFMEYTVPQSEARTRILNLYGNQTLHLVDHTHLAVSTLTLFKI
jgi:hypothetical protein